MMDKRKPLNPVALPLDQWPAAEREAWVAALAPRHSLFGSTGAASHLRPATVASYANAVGGWLAHLRRYGWLLENESPISRFRTETLNRFVGDMDERGLQPSSIKQILRMLRAGVKFMLPGADLSFLTNPNGLALNKALPSQRREVSSPDPWLPMPLARQMHLDALAMPHSAERWRQLRDAALAGIFTLRGMRRASVERMRLDGLVRQEDGTHVIHLSAEDTKNHRPRQEPLTAEVSRMVDDYLDLGRPNFPRATISDHVWMGMKGPMTPEGISKCYEEFSRACYGQPYGTHTARRTIRSNASRISPDAAFDAAVSLDHSHEVSAIHYAESQNLHVGLRHGERIERQREWDTAPTPAQVTRPQFREVNMTGFRRAGRGRSAYRG